MHKVSSMDLEPEILSEPNALTFFIQGFVPRTVHQYIRRA